jgi:SAM-dependent MidA family methyltransferase
MSDIWRASKAEPRFRDALRIFLLEPSKVLRAAQVDTLADVGGQTSWIDDFDDAPEGPCILIGNELLDCLPIRQFIRTEDGWLERVVGRADDDLSFGLIPAPSDFDAAFAGKPIGAIVEIRMGLPAFIDKIADKVREGGRALLIDYGSHGSEGDTFQAMRAQASADPLEEPGAADLTAHVDFAVVAALARKAGLSVSPTISQRALLRNLGIEARAKALQKSRPDKAQIIERQLQRLIAEDQMGELFQAVCLSSPGLPPPVGFRS